MEDSESITAAAGNLPLQGVVLCCTAISHDIRAQVENVIKPMGATHNSDLTSDVTHLIVGSLSTPKYRYVAKERPEVRVLHVDWIEALRRAWMAGGDVDVPGLETAHRLPVFFDLKICITGFDDLAERTAISDAIESAGAAYHKDLTKDVSHLVAAAPHGAKYAAARQWGIPIVSLKWLKDSLRRGMALDEALYDPVMALEEQGKGAFREVPRSRTSLGKRTRDSTGVEAGGVADAMASKRKLRRTVSSRLDSQSQDLWQDLSVRDVGLARTEADRWRDDETSDALRRAESHEDDATTSAVAGMEPPAKEHDRSSGPNEHSKDTAANPEPLFSGRHVLIHGFEQKKVERLRAFLEPNGATVAQTSSDLENSSHDPFFQARYLLVPHSISTASPPPLPSVPPGTILASEWWIERSIHFKTLQDPSADPLSRPLWNVQIPAFSTLRISTTGFSGVDVRQMAEAVRLMGGTYLEVVTPESSVLISGSAAVKKEKAFYARKHRIPLVRPAWLWECLLRKAVVGFEEFRVDGGAQEVEGKGEAEALFDARSEAGKGKGKDALGSKGKDSLRGQRLSNTRRCTVTPSLPLQVSKSYLPAAGAKPMPFVHEDDDDGVDPSAPAFHDDSNPSANKESTQRSQPLREVSPNLSPRKPAETSNTGKPAQKPSIKAPAKESPHTFALLPPSSELSNQTPKTTSAAPTLRNEADLTADLAALLHRTTSSRFNNPTNPSSNPPLKRKKRPLGRNLSGISNRSTPTSEPPNPPLYDGNSADSPDTNPSFTNPIEPQPPMSTQLEYAPPEAEEAHRALLGRKVRLDGAEGGLMPGLVRVERVGVVKDSEVLSATSAAGGVGGVAGRVRVRARGR